MTEYEKKRIELEEKKIATLETIASSVDALTLWIEEVDKEEWGGRIEHYLAEFYKIATSDKEK